jgi:hypothetical protein
MEAKRELPLKSRGPFDDAIRRALTVKPPTGGWAKYEAELKRKRQRRKKAAAK